jgi:hydroxymethylbilane synthase
MLSSSGYSIDPHGRTQLRRSNRPIIIASRKSQLARVQAESIGAALSKRHPKVEVQFQWIESEGDQKLDVPLVDSGGKGLFAKAVERALIQEQADIAVHSLKDLPVGDTPGLMLAAIPKREDPRDCLITRNGESSLAQLNGGAIFGTASPRRAAQVKSIRPDLRIELIRGNVQTRLRKIQDLIPGGPMYAASLMAVSGLKRAGLSQHTQYILDPDVILPAASQGALALQCRSSDHVTIRRLLPLNHATTAQAVELERQVVAGLQGDCHSPIAALAQPIEEAGKAGFRLRAKVFSPDGSNSVQADERASRSKLRRLGKNVLKKLLDQGARQLLKHK